MQREKVGVSATSNACHQESPPLLWLPPYCAGGGQELRSSAFYLQGACRCWAAGSTTGRRADFQSTAFTGKKHCLTARNLVPPPKELAYDTQTQKCQHCAAHTGLF